MQLLFDNMPVRSFSAPRVFVHLLCYTLTKFGSISIALVASAIAYPYASDLIFACSSQSHDQRGTTTNSVASLLELGLSNMRQQYRPTQLPLYRSLSQQASRAPRMPYCRRS